MQTGYIDIGISYISAKNIGFVFRSQIVATLKQTEQNKVKTAADKKIAHQNEIDLVALKGLHVHE